VLLAMGCDDERARGLLRLSLGRFNTQEEVARFLEILPQAVAMLTGAHNQASLAVEAVAGVPA